MTDSRPPEGHDDPIAEPEYKQPGAAAPAHPGEGHDGDQQSSQDPPA